MSDLATRELVVVACAYLLAAVPVAGALLAGRMSPLYQLPLEVLGRWWSWFALAIVLAAIALELAARFA